ncbi:MAG: hypothetical protein IBJ11_05300 [Phycisphaerales bacterium]|nr:hypothetical protein [Phycisphaerales bacterium]
MTTANLRPGQKLKLTVTSAPRSFGATSTIERLMRQDPDIRRRLKGAQEHRMKNLYVRSRGMRPWEVRRPASKYVSATPGNSWTMTFFPHIAPDVASVAEYLKIENA